MDELSKAQTNEIETSSMKSQENGLKSSSESSGKHSLSNGSVVLKDNMDGMPVVDSQQTNRKQENGMANGVSSNKDDFSSDLIEKIDFPEAGIEEKNNHAQKSDSETSSTLSSSSDESEDESNGKEEEKQVKESRSQDDQGSNQSATVSSGDQDKNSTLYSEKEELTQKLQEAWSKCEEFKDEAKSIQKENDVLEDKLSAANEKNKNLSDTTEDLKKIKQELQRDLDNNNQQLQSKLLVLDERDGTIERLRSGIADMQSGKGSLESELQDAREEINNLQSAQENKELSTKQQEDKFDNLKAKADEQEHDIGELKVQLEMAKKEIEMHRNYNTEVIKKDGTIERLRSGIADMQSGKDSLENELQDAREELNDLQSAQEKNEISTKQQEEKFDNLKAKADEQEHDIGELKVQLEMSKKEIELHAGYKTEVNKRDGTIEKMRSEIADIQSGKDLLENELQDAREELNNLQSAQEKNEIPTKQQEEKFDNLQAKADEQEQDIGKLKVQLEMAKKEIEMHGSDKTDVEEKLRDELGNAKNTIRSVNQANSKLEAKLSNSQTIIETAEVESKKFKEEVKSLKDKIKWLERRRASEKEGSPKSITRSETASKAELMDRKISQESHRRIQERVKELEQKVIQVNDEKQKLKHDYDEAVKALEAVDKVYSVRELALQQYKSDLDDANELLKQKSSEIHHLKLEMDQLQVDLKRAEQNKEENKAEREELKEQLTKSKEANRIYKEEIEDVRKELKDQVHELQLAQTKGRERGKKNQILELEVREIKETLLISKNVIEEKEKNMESLREDLSKEKKKCKTLQQELEELDYLNKKIQLIEDEKARIVDKMKRAETDLKETQEALKKICIKIKEMEKEKESQIKNNQMLKNKCESQDYEIQTLIEVVENKESDIEQQLIELIHTRAQVDELSLQMQDMWASYCVDKALWKNRGGRSIRRRYKSAPSKRIQQASPPIYQSPPETKTHSLAHRRLVNKLGLPVVNPEYINTKHMDVPQATTQKPAQNNEVQDVPDSSPLPPNNNLKVTDSTSQTSNGTKESPPKLSPRPPANNIDKTKAHRPHYGVHTYPPTNGEHNRTFNDNALNEGVWLHMDGVSITSGDTDEEIVKYLVNKGDRVMIQSKVVGDDSINVSGVVKYVGKVGKKMTSPVYVGLKLDQPFGDNNGTVAGKRFFSCQPRHGKVTKMSEIKAVMHPRSKNYDRVKSTTLNW